VEETEKNHSQDLLQRWQQNIMMNLTNISQWGSWSWISFVSNRRQWYYKC